VDMVELPLGQRAAIESLLKIALRDTGQSRRVADFLLAWYNASGNGGWDPGDLWAVEAAIASDMMTVLDLIHRGPAGRYPNVTRKTSLMAYDGVQVLTLADGPGAGCRRLGSWRPTTGYSIRASFIVTDETERQCAIGSPRARYHLTQASDDAPGLIWA